MKIKLLVLLAVAALAAVSASSASAYPLLDGSAAAASDQTTDPSSQPADPTVDPTTCPAQTDPGSSDSTSTDQTGSTDSSSQDAQAADSTDCPSTDGSTDDSTDDSNGQGASSWCNNSTYTDSGATCGDPTMDGRNGDWIWVYCNTTGVTWASDGSYAKDTSDDGFGGTGGAECKSWTLLYPDGSTATYHYKGGSGSGDQGGSGSGDQGQQAPDDTGYGVNVYGGHIIGPYDLNSSEYVSVACDNGDEWEVVIGSGDFTCPAAATGNGDQGTAGGTTTDGTTCDPTADPTCDTQGDGSGNMCDPTADPTCTQPGDGSGDPTCDPTADPTCDTQSAFNPGVDNDGIGVNMGEDGQVDQSLTQSVDQPVASADGSPDQASPQPVDGGTFKFVNLPTN